MLIQITSNTLWAKTRCEECFVGQNVGWRVLGGSGCVEDAEDVRTKAVTVH